MGRSVCPFCGLGCTLVLRRGERSPCHGAEGVPSLDYDVDGPVNRGSLCAKGNMALELVTHPLRLDQAFVREDGRRRAVPYADAVVRAASGLAVADGRGDRVGVLLGPWLTREETRAAIELAGALGTRHVDLASPEDATVCAGLDLAGAAAEPVRTAREIEAMTAILVVGDLFTFAPCIAKPVLTARYDRRQNLLGVLAGGAHRTAWFAKPRLACRPGREAAALAAMLRVLLQDGKPVRGTPAAALREVLEPFGPDGLAASSGLDPEAAGPFLRELRDRPETGVLLAPGLGAREAEPLVAGLAARLAEITGSRLLVVPSGAGTLGVLSELTAADLPGPEGLTAAEMLEAAATGDLRALLVLGADPLASYPGGLPDRVRDGVGFLVATASLPGETSTVADVVLPAATWGEKAGTTVTALGGEMQLTAAIPPPGAARSDGEILAALRAALPARAGPAPVALVPLRRAASFADEVDFHLRFVRRADDDVVRGRLVVSRHLSPHGGDGEMTRHFSWPRHEFPEPCVCLTPADAREIGAREGSPVEVRTGEGRAVLAARIQSNVPPGTVLVPFCCREVRRLFPWRTDPATGQVDTPPVRGGIAAAPEKEVVHA